MRGFIFFAFLTLTGCTYPISENMRASLDPSVSVSGLFDSPDAYIGKRVMLGGTIVETRNLPGVSEIEVVQKPIGSSGNLDSGDTTLGRFIFRRQGYLEAEVYTKGREVIGAGVVVGGQKGKIGDLDYLFTVVEPEELKLLPEYSDTPYYYDPFYPYYFYGGYGYAHGPYGHYYW